MDNFYKFLGTFFGFFTDATSLLWERLVDYKDFFWRLTKWFAVFAAIPIPVLIICLIFGWQANWLYSAYFIFVGSEAVILLVLAFPIIAAAQILFDNFPKFAGSIRKSVQVIAAVAFWALMLAVYFYVFPVWNNPAMIPLVLMAAAALAFGAYAGWVGLRIDTVRRFTAVFLVGILVIATFAFCFPNRTRQLVGLLHNIDETASTPKQVKFESPDQIGFVNSKGVPQIWYYRSPTGEYELYDREGFHRSGARLKLAETAEERNQIITWFRDHAQRKQEETRKAEERQKQIEQQQDQEQARQKRETSQSYFNGSRERSAALDQHARAPNLTPPRKIGSKAEEEAVRQKLMLATVPGASYIGTISRNDVQCRLHLVFTEQKGFLIRAEVTCPDKPKEKQTFAGEMVFNSQQNASYPIVMSPTGGSNWAATGDVLWFFRGSEGSLKLRLTDVGLEGETGGWQFGGFEIRLQREGTSSVEQRKADEEPVRQKLILATAQGTGYIGTISDQNSRTRRIRLVFTEQKGFLLRAEVSNPDNSKQKRTFTGELVFNPKPERNSPVVYTIVMGPVGEGTSKGSTTLEYLYSDASMPLKLRLTDTGLEGEAYPNPVFGIITIRLQPEATTIGIAPNAHADTLKNKQTGKQIQGSMTGQKINGKSVFKLKTGQTLFLDVTEWEPMDPGADSGATSKTPDTPAASAPAAPLGR